MHARDTRIYDVLKTFRTTLHAVDILHLPADVLILLFSWLHAQDIARCAAVCRYFSALVVSNLSLQYRIELARNGMVDGDSAANALPLAERLQRLRRYSSKFRTGDFNHIDLSEHPEYILRMRKLRKNTTIPGDIPSSAVYGRYEQGESESFLSIFTPGSTQAGIPSTRCLLPVEQRVVKKWTMDHAQDLLVTVEWADKAISGPTLPWLEEVNFYSLSGSMTARTPHPAATVPSVTIFPPDGVDPTAEVRVFKICVAGEHVVWESYVARSPGYNLPLDVWNWRTGQLTKRIDVGLEVVNFVLLDRVYALVTQRDSASCVDIYSISQSTPTHRLCTPELPPEKTDNFPVSCRISTGERPAPSNGYFRGDPSQTMVSITLTTNDLHREYASVLLIPHATILAQIQAAESRQQDGDTAKLGLRVAWADWGRRGCLRLRLELPHRSYYMSLLPCGSRAPVVVFRGPDDKTDEFFVFDVNPLASRYAKHVLAMRRDLSASDSVPEGTVIIEDVEDVLPGVVDPECLGIPYVVYRFKLPYTCRSMDWSVGGLTMQGVEMGMTGFTVKFEGVSFEETLQTWTV